MAAILIDTETTGVREPEPVEVAWVRLPAPADVRITGPGLERWTGTPGQSDTTDLYLNRFLPSKPIELGALATHHILDEELADCPPSESFTLPPDTLFLIGHNIGYDARVIRRPDLRQICTLGLSRHFWPEASSHSLGAMLYYLHRQEAREWLRDAHGAAADVRNCLRLLRDILGKMGTPATWEEVWQFSEVARVPTKMSFGKHKGKLIAEVPADYKLWMLRQDDVDPYLARALRS